ncbi:MAG: antitoxin VapB family protein [Candidatus Nanohaloarchaea archaeon]
MSSKNISISESAYRKLKALKRENESFTDAVNRLTSERSLLDIAGVLSDEEADEIRDRVKDMRDRSRDRVEDVAGAMEE